VSPPPARPLRLGLLQYPVERPASIAAWGAKLDQWIALAKGRADLLLLPECVELGAAPVGREGTDETTELAAMVANAKPIPTGTLRHASVAADARNLASPLSRPRSWPPGLAHHDQRRPAAKLLMRRASLAICRVRSSKNAPQAARVTAR